MRLRFIAVERSLLVLNLRQCLGNQVRGLGQAAAQKR